MALSMSECLRLSPTRRPRLSGRTCLALALTLALVLGPWAGPSARAQEPAAPPAPTPDRARGELWLTLSASLITAGVAGGFALKVGALHDRSGLLPVNSPERPSLDQQATDARRYAVGFGVAASLLTLTSVLLLLYQPTLPDASPTTTTQLTPALGPRHFGVACRGNF